MNARLTAIAAILLIGLTTEQQAYATNNYLVINRPGQTTPASCPTLVPSTCPTFPTAVEAKFKAFVTKLQTIIQNTSDVCPPLSAAEALCASSSLYGRVTMALMPDHAQIVSTGYQVFSGFYYQKIVYYYESAYNYVMYWTGMRAFRLLATTPAKSTTTKKTSKTTTKTTSTTPAKTTAAAAASSSQYVNTPVSAADQQKLLKKLAELNAADLVEGMMLAPTLDTLLVCAPESFCLSGVECKLTPTNIATYVKY